VHTESDELLAVTCAAQRLVLLTTRRLIEFDGKHDYALHLTDELGSGLVSSTHATLEQFFAGLNAGEWGGGLRVIDRRTGKVTVVERNAGAALCGGPLNTSCDPVNVIAAKPGKPGCIGVAASLVHMEPHGRVLKVYGNQVKRLFYKPYGKVASFTAAQFHGTDSSAPYQLPANEFASNRESPVIALMSTNSKSLACSVWICEIVLALHCESGSPCTYMSVPMSATYSP